MCLTSLEIWCWRGLLFRRYILLTSRKYTLIFVVSHHSSWSRGFWVIGKSTSSLTIPIWSTRPSGTVTMMQSHPQASNNCNIEHQRDLLLHWRLQQLTFGIAWSSAFHDSHCLQAHLRICFRLVTPWAASMNTPAEGKCMIFSLRHLDQSHHSQCLSFSQSMTFHMRKLRYEIVLWLDNQTCCAIVDTYLM